MLLEQPQGRARVGQGQPHLLEARVTAGVDIHLDQRAHGGDAGQRQADEQVLAQLAHLARLAARAGQELTTFAVAGVGGQERAQRGHGPVRVTLLEEFSRGRDHPGSALERTSCGDQARPQIELQGRVRGLAQGRHDQGRPGAPGVPGLALIAGPVKQLAHVRGVRVRALEELCGQPLEARHPVGLVEARSLEPVHDRLRRVAEAMIEATQQGAPPGRGHGAQRGAQPTAEPFGLEQLGHVLRQRARLTVSAPGLDAHGGA